MNPGVVKSWKKITVMALVFDDASHRHEADSALFYEFARRRHEIGAFSPEENRRLAAAQKAQELAADRANYLTARQQATAEGGQRQLRRRRARRQSRAAGVGERGARVLRSGAPAPDLGEDGQPLRRGRCARVHIRGQPAPR